VGVERSAQKMSEGGVGLTLQPLLDFEQSTVVVLRE
jgi:hypothetical protein